MNQNHENPMGTRGFAFLLYSSLDAQRLCQQFEQFGFVHTDQHKTKDIRVYRQGEIRYLIDLEPGAYSTAFAREHGPSVAAMGFAVADADQAYQRAIAMGAEPCEQSAIDLPAIIGVGGSLIYFVDDKNAKSLYNNAFQPVADATTDYHGVGLLATDHVTHNLNIGQIQVWKKFYESLFNFKEIRYFDIKGQKTGLVSHAMTSPCGNIRIPLNEPTEAGSQIQEFIDEFDGEGIQHIAMSTDNIYQTVEALRARGIAFADTPDTYYEGIKQRVPWHAEDLARLQKNKILLDGTPTPEGGLLMQIFTETMLGPVFFEVIHRKKNEGFGEGNFQALFESMELDQMRRGVL